MSRLFEFFEDSSGRLSMVSLLLFLSVFPAWYLAFKIGDNTALATVVGAYVLNRLGGKYADGYKNGKNSNKGDINVSDSTIINKE